VAARVYLAGIIIFTLRLLAGVTRLIRIATKGSVINNIVTVNQGSNFSGFSALGYIFINSSLSNDEKEKIILHEKIHIRLLHHLDIILFEIIIILQWMNPFIYLIRYSVRAVHEYHTDREYISGKGKIADYQKMIFNEIFGTRNIPIASCFSAKSLTKKRIMMMTKRETRPGAVIKVLIAVPLAVALIFMLSCNKSIVMPDTPLTSMIDEPIEMIIFMPGDTTSSSLIVPKERLEAVKDSIRKAHAETIKKTVVDKPALPSEVVIFVDGEKRDQEFLASLNHSEIESISVLKPDAARAVYGAIGAGGAIEIKTKKSQLLTVNSKDDVFQIVEKMPTFQGGDIQKFSNWVQANISYPPAARESGKQGKVFISFIVEPDGKVTNVKVIRSIDPLLDDEAVRGVKSAPDWEPGLQKGTPVRVSFSMTINFQLK
jgi:TonB family protein